MRGCRQALQFLCHACGEFSPSCPALESHSDEFAVLQRMEELLEKLRYFAGDHDMGPSERPTVRKAVRVSLVYDAHSPERRAQTRSTCHRSADHTSELQSLIRHSYPVLCLTK